MKHVHLSLAILFVCAIACREAHDHHHDHNSGDSEPEALAITRWTDRYELFVELPVPTPGDPIAYHAHVTRLSDFAAVTAGAFTVRFKNAGAVVAEAKQTGVKRPGIFVFESLAPPAGVYELEMSYELDGAIDVFDCGSIDVSIMASEPAEETASAAITFLKESQWKIELATAWAVEQSIARELELAATIEPASVDQLTVGAATAGRFFHRPKLALGEGTRVKKGEVLGTIAPSAAGEDFNRLQLAVEESALAMEQLHRELERVTPLVAQKLLPERRKTELENAIATHRTRLRSAGARLEGVVSPAQGLGITVRSSLEGSIAEVLVPNGAPVEAGAPLIRVGGTDHMWIRARFVAKAPASLQHAKPIGARLPNGARVDLEQLGATFLSSLPVIDPASRTATWIADVPRPDPQLLSGSSVVLAVRVGEARPLLAIPREAVVEINTRPYVFVQIDGEHFEKRAVVLGQVDGPWVQVLKGVSKGERIVSRGGFDIHLASMMGTIESHRH